MTIVTAHDHLRRIVADLNADRGVSDLDDVTVLAAAIVGGAVRFTTAGAEVVTDPSPVGIAVPNLPTAVEVRSRIANAHQLGATGIAPIRHGVDVVVRPDKDDLWVLGYEPGRNGDLLDWIGDLSVEQSDDSDSDEWVRAADLVDGDVVDLSTVPILSIEPSAPFELAQVESAVRENDRVVGLHTDGGSAGVPAGLWVRRTGHAHLAADIIGGTDPESAVETIVGRVREAEQANAETAVMQGDLPGSAMADCQSAGWILGSVEQMDDDILEGIVGYGIPGGVVRAILASYFADEIAAGQSQTGRMVESWSEAGVAKIAEAMGVSTDEVRATLSGDLAEPALVTVVPGRSWLVYREQEAADGTWTREWAGGIDAVDGLFDAHCKVCGIESAGHETRREAANLLVRRHGPDGRGHSTAVAGIEFVGMSRVEATEDGRVRVLLSVTGEIVAVLPAGASRDDADVAVGRWLTAGRPSPTHTGSDPERGSVGLPGHCEDCAAVGHVQAHPELGCGDVGCTAAHDEAPVPSPVAGSVSLPPAARKAAVGTVAAILGVSRADAGNLIDGTGDPAGDTAMLVGRVVEAYATRTPDAIVVARLLAAVHGIDAAWDADDGDQVLVVFHDRAKAAWWGPDGLVVETADGQRLTASSSPDPAKVADRIARLSGEAG
ncbi:hypothetical protein DVS28_b0193 (plasmid) [Euzebya pacifica]|uniref:Uncharacterized protein n=1 Tax=Euzebya pacifica TaxID=1608957 RepID=A0A346Y666_9ACTN|nr:hypothetical protein [Euzebya pacifica]AXV09963.1 hypothetical protein DVS28_b0193 [Euzebya pacifica]